jgi:hypothetical protein
MPMHAVVVDVTINDQEAAASTLRDRVVPMVSGAPGFVAGYWLGAGPGKGHSIVVFESQEAAQAVADQVASPGDEVTIDRVEVHEVVAHA